MNGVWNFEHCISVLTGEIELLKKISAIQEEVRQAVLKREWDEFDEKSAEINSLSEEFSVLEKERVDLFSALSGPDSPLTIEEGSFYASIMKFPDKERQDLSRLYRELKMETTRVQALNESFLDYINDTKTLATAYIEALNPSGGGVMYTRTGSKVSQDLRSMVVNNSF